MDKATSTKEELQTGNPLFAKKTLDQLFAESKESGEHSLKKTLGPFQLTALGVGAVIGASVV